ncbi:hypothetical protein Acr_14g0006420 [Actinidia rufa]|uniref:Uncharacterized protein n=1 Tax=Actinidia rufa TaxID=165716 RepID=A0A7J0FRH8_9ERIC|nr:hypothetical protein Acr_14g0006420 [Actinidia rufa]
MLKASLSVEVNNLIEGTTAELARLRQEVERQSIGSNRSSSFDLFGLNNEDAGEEVAGEVGDKEEDTEVEEGEEVNRIKDQVPSIAIPA